MNRFLETRFPVLRTLFCVSLSLTLESRAKLDNFVVCICTLFRLNSFKLSFKNVTHRIYLHFYGQQHFVLHDRIGNPLSSQFQIAKH